MGTPSGANCNQQLPPKMLLPPLQQPVRTPTWQQTPLSIVPLNSRAPPEDQEPGSNSDQAHDSATESASSLETWPIERNPPNAMKRSEKSKDVDNEVSDLQVIRRVSCADKLSLREVARDRVETISDRMAVMPDEILDELKSELRVILEGVGGMQHQEEFLYLQKLMQSRADLTAKTLLRAHRVQLEILVAINTGIQAFLLPNISIMQNRLIEVFTYKRCSNLACQNALPADDCSCLICATRSGFCNLCMCVVCNKFDFEANTCRWIGCDSCSHWTHTNCAICVGQIGMETSAKGGAEAAEMVFRCQACSRSSELLGWVKDVYEHCAPGWDRESLMTELEYVSRIFQASEEPRGRKLFLMCNELMRKIKTGFADSAARRMLLLFFQELELDSAKKTETEEIGLLIAAPQEACNRIVEVVQETVRKMELVAEEKLRMFKRARLALEACDRDLEDKAREVAELKIERQRKKQQVEELESIIRLKQAEAEMFQLKAMEAQQDAERLQSIALTKSEKSEKDYASTYLKRRLDEAEAEKQYLFEKMKLQESHQAAVGSSSRGSETSQTPMLCKIQDLLKNMYNVPPKTDEQQQPTDLRSLNSVP